MQQNSVKAPFGMTMKIHDRYNHNQVVKLSENGMEMHPDAGRALCDVMDEIEEDQGYVLIPMLLVDFWMFC